MEKAHKDKNLIAAKRSEMKYLDTFHTLLFIDQLMFGSRILGFVEFLCYRIY